MASVAGLREQTILFFHFRCDFVDDSKKRGFTGDISSLSEKPSLRAEVLMKRVRRLE